MRKLFVILLSIQTALFAQVYRQSNARLGWQSNETVLTPTSVAAGHFGVTGHLCNNQITGAVYAQPQYIASSSRMLVVTMSNDAYLCDATIPTSAAIWHVNLGAPGTDTTGLLYNSQVGCLASPAVDTTNSVAYVVCSTATPTWVLYKLNLSTGATVASVTVTGVYPGTGDPCTTRWGNPCTESDTTSGGNVVFFPKYELCRMAVTLTAAGNIYVGCGSRADLAPWHGWIFGYNSALTQIGVFCTTPSSEGGGLSWGGGAAEDVSGNLYVVTGNGNYDGSTNYSVSVLKFNATLALQDWFTPTDWATRNSTDSDIASSNPMLIPGTSLITFSTKSYDIISATYTCLGHLGGTVSGCPGYQTVALGTPAITDHSGSYGDLFNPNTNMGYFPVTTGYVFKSSLASTTWGSASNASSGTYPYPGGVLSGSSNGSSTPIVWCMSSTVDSEVQAEPGVLQALDSSTLAVLWSSPIPGSFSKFQAAVVPGNGNIYVGTYSEGVVVLGIAMPTYTILARE